MDIKQKFTQLWYTELPAILTLLSGILLTIYPEILSHLCWIGGGILELTGIVMILHYFLKKGQPQSQLRRSILFLVTGLVVACIPSFLMLFIPLILGAWLIVSSISDIYGQFFVKKQVQWIGILFCVLGLGIGIFVMTRPQTAINSSLRIIGIAMVIHAVLHLVSVFLECHFYGTSTNIQENVIDTVIDEKES